MTSRWSEAQREIGRYIVAFSVLLATMRWAIEVKLEGWSPRLSKLALGELTAAQITNAFFAICEEVADFDDEEAQVAKRLKNEVIDAISERNDFAHGDWWHYTGKEGLPGFRLRRTKPGRKAGAAVDTMRTPEALGETADHLEDLVDVVREFGQLCLGTHPLRETGGIDVRVRDIYRFRNRRVLRIGRHADTSVNP